MTLQNKFDYENIIQLSSKGLNDDLTGTFTRVIFLDRAEAMLRKRETGRSDTGPLFYRPG